MHEVMLILHRRESKQMQSAVLNSRPYLETKPENFMALNFFGNLATRAASGIGSVARTASDFTNAASSADSSMEQVKTSAETAADAKQSAKFQEMIRQNTMQIKAFETATKIANDRETVVNKHNNAQTATWKEVQY